MELITNYENAVNAIVVEFKKKHNLYSPDGYWIGNQIGEIYDFGDAMTFNFHDILTDIKENAPEEEITKWNTYLSRIWGINNMVGGIVLKELSYQSWLHGAPRLSDEQLTTIENKWKKLVDEISELGKTSLDNNEKDVL